jgi:hypothetical protein
MAAVQLHRICFVSRIHPELQSLDLRAIVQSSAARNELSRIGSFMVADGGFFAQVIEGPAGEVRALAARIRRDPRHTDMQIVLEGAASEREFSEWSMAAFDFDRGWGLPVPVRALRRALHRFLSGAILGSPDDPSGLFRECLRQHRNQIVPLELLIEPGGPPGPH